MIAAKERLRCQRCIGGFLVHDGDSLTCVNCGRDHDREGNLIHHPIGFAGFEVRGRRFDKRYEPNLH